MLEIITPAASLDLATLSETKTYLSIVGTAEDTTLAWQITAASQAIQGWLRRTIALETVEEQLECYSSTLVVQRWPIGAVVSITEENVTLTASQYKLDVGTGIVYRREPGAIGNQLWSGFVVIRYSAGFATIPAIVREATFLAVKFARESLARETGVKSERFEGEAMLAYFAPDGSGLPTEVTSRLASFKSLHLC